MAAPLNGNNGITDEWFLKRYGRYADDLIINLDQDEVVVGRGNNKGLKNSPGVSRRHAFFKKSTNDHWLVKDLCSTNGLYINRKKIAVDCLEPIRESDVIGLGVANAISNDQFSFTLCRRHKFQLVNGNNAEGEMKEQYREALSRRFSTESEQNNICESSNNLLNLNVSKENIYIEQEPKNHYTEASDSMKCVESKQNSTFDLNKSEISNNCIILNVSEEIPENTEIRMKEDRLSNTICDIYKFNCKIVVERCDDKTNCNINSVQNKKNDCSKEEDQENFSAFNVSPKTDDSDNSNQIPKTRSNKKVIISDTDNSNDENDIIVPMKLNKKKSIILSEESDSSNEEILLKSAFPDKTDNTHQTERKHNLDITKENLIVQYGSNDGKSEENKYSQLKEHSTHCSDDSQLKENNSTDITNSKSKGNKMKPESDEKVYMEKKELSDLHDGIDCITISDDLSSNNTEKCNMAECKSTDVINLDINIMPVEITEKENLSEINNRSKPTSNSDNIIILEEEENFGYSQNDDIIIISDDEDLPTIKQEPNEFLNIKEFIDLTDVHIKKEPSDGVSCIWQKYEIEKSIAQQNIYDTDVKNEYHCSDDDMPICETADELFDFGNDIHNVDEKELFGRITWPPTPDDVNKEIPENDFFPNLSQTFFSDDSSSHTSSDVDIKEVDNESELTKSKTKEAPPLKSTSNGNKCRTNSVQPIEALPMHYRPKRTRGQEEWFTERIIEGSNDDIAINTIATTSTDTPSEASKRKFYGKTMGKKPPSKIGSSNTVKKKKGPSLKQRLKENMGHRVRCPGGGSAIIKQDISASSTSHTTVTKAKSNSQWSKTINETTKRLPSSVTNAYSSNKPKNVHSAQVVQRFPSRTEQLTKSMLVKNSSVSDNRKQNCMQQNVAEKSDSTEKQNILSSRKQNIASHSTIKNQKRTNPFGNFKIPKKKKTNGPEKILSLNQSNFHASPNTKQQNPDKCRQETPLSNNNVKSQVSISKCISDPISAISKDTKCLKNDQNQKNKKVRFAEEIIPCIERKVLLPIANSIAPIKSNTLKNSSSAFNASLEPIPGLCTRNCISQENIIGKIVCWNISWLKEQRINTRPPPIVNFSILKKVAWHYTSADAHWNTYFDFLLLEMWQSVYQAWRDSDNKHTDHFAITSLQQFNDMMILNCQTIVLATRNKTLTFMEGHLAVVELVLRTKNKATAVATTFGYLCDCKMERYRIESSHPLLQTSLTSTANASHLVNFVLKIKYREDSVNLSKLMKIKPILYLRPLLRQCEALQNMYDCPLQRCILSPQQRLCSFNNVSQGALRSKGTYNENQKRAILGIASAVLDSPEPRLLLLHGPPGTGKTHTIVAIIQQLLFRYVKNADQQVKMLVAAPSNAAVDEIGRRLLKLRSCLIASNGKRVRFVRVGQPGMVHKDLKMYFIDELVKLNLQNSNMEHDYETIINHLQAKINMLQQEISSRQEHNPYDPVIARKRKELENARKEFQSYKSKSNRHGCIDDKQKYKLKIDILTKADVILTTLNSCRQGILESAFGKNSAVTFTCCIIDEATQCTEPEILIPFHYRMNKVLLVGDPQQLPATVFSRLAVQYGFQVSLFERLNNYFNETPGENPVFMLTDQYRMHPEICTYPSSYFYSDRLKSCGIGPHFVKFPVKRYLVLDIIDSQESIDNPTNIYNRAEARFVEFVCTETLRLIPSTCTLGVITPYQGQRQIINKYFQSTMTRELHRLEVNTVDGFQGREHDVIILSCVRASNYTGNIGFLDDRQRLNVAITRARYSLIICGHMASLRSHQHWGSLIRNAETRNLIHPVKSSSLEEVYDLLKADPIQR